MAKKGTLKNIKDQPEFMVNIWDLTEVLAYKNPIHTTATLRIKMRFWRIKTLYWVLCVPVSTRRQQRRSSLRRLHALSRLCPGGDGISRRCIESYGTLSSFLLSFSNFFSFSLYIAVIRFSYIAPCRPWIFIDVSVRILILMQLLIVSKINLPWNFYYIVVWNSFSILNANFVIVLYCFDAFNCLILECFSGFGFCCIISWSFAVFHFSWLKNDTFLIRDIKVCKKFVIQQSGSEEAVHVFILWQKATLDQSVSA